MTAMAHGEIEPLGTLYMRYGKPVRQLLHRLYRELQVGEVEDLVHDVFLQLHRGADRYRHRGNLYAWICGIAVRAARGHRRKRWLRGRLQGAYGDAQQRPQLVRADAPADARLELERALSALNEQQRLVLLLHVVDGLSAQQIALSLGISEKTVWTRIHRARKAMEAVRRPQVKR